MLPTVLERALTKAEARGRWKQSSNFNKVVAHARKGGCVCVLKGGQRDAKGAGVLGGARRKGCGAVLGCLAKGMLTA
jgi:hypothetical protein